MYKCRNNLNKCELSRFSQITYRSYSTFCLRYIIIPWIGAVSLVFTIDFGYYSYPISCLENPVDRGAWWAAVHRVAQSRTRPKQLSSNSSIYVSILKKERSCEQFELCKIISLVSGITSYEFQSYSLNCWLIAFSRLSSLS